ncbi:MAG: radical SAM protein [Chitinivibrionales bacterium]|nr:radical SAM protein [Chitinivibrionales bacterium]
MKILLLHPKINYDNMEPLGLLLLATVCRQHGFDVRVLDIFPDDNDYYMHKTLEFRPDIIGYGFETPAYPRVIEINRTLRARYPSALYCAGGVHTSSTPEQTLRECDLDIVVIGEAEVSFPLLCTAHAEGRALDSIPGTGYLRGDTYIQTSPPPPVENLDSLPVIDRTLLDCHQFYFSPPGNIRGLVRPGTATMITSRGCPYACAFCDSKSVTGKHCRRRSVENVVEEMKYLHSTFGITAVYFADDIFASNNTWTEHFCRTLIESNLHMRWGCQCRADGISESMVKLMKQAGCIQIDMGVESGDPLVLDELNKGESVETFIRAARIIRNNKVRLLCSFIVGAPAETWESIEKTASLIRQLKPSLTQVFSLIPYPGAPIWRRAIDNGWISPRLHLHGYSQKSGGGPVLSCGLSPDDHARARKFLQRIHFLSHYRGLIFGWLRYPRYLLLIIFSWISNGFYYHDLITGIRQRNPVLYCEAVYAGFNRYMRDTIRNRTIKTEAAVGERAADLKISARFAGIMPLQKIKQTVSVCLNFINISLH